MHPVVDHLVYGVGDLDEGIDRLERQLGTRAVFGGQHAGRGTQNALLGLGEATYLELIAPDPDQHPAAGVLPFGVHAGMAPGLVGWATRTHDIQASVAQARAAGYDPGTVASMQRHTPDGTLLRWRLTSTATAAANLLVPFLIDWADTPHPARTAPTAGTLAALRATHPHPAAIRNQLAAIHTDLSVEPGPVAALLATLDTTNGPVELR